MLSLTSLTPPRPPRVLLALLALALGAALACSEREPTAPAPRPPDPARPLLDRRAAGAARCDADNGGLTLPPGFCALVVARDVGLARHITVRPNGDIYVALNNSPTGALRGSVLALRDADGDGRADVMRRFGPDGGNGIAFANGFLWFAMNDRIVRWRLGPEALEPAGAFETIVSGMPALGDHVSKTIVLTGADGMFVNVGSESNSCQRRNRIDFSPGVEPCSELPVRAGVWLYSASTPGQTHSPSNRFAAGLRNMVALAVAPQDGRLYGVQNGRDQLFDNWPDRFTLADDNTLPAEELFRIDRGASYGWPYCFYDGLAGRKVLAPEYNGDGQRAGACANYRQPLATYPAHWAPLSMLFYSGTQFPARYRSGVFIAFHGSRFNPTLQPAGPGYNVVFQPFAGGVPVGGFEEFAGGFTGGAMPLPAAALHRPVGLAQGPDGSLYITDDKGGTIWRVLYTGE